MNYDLKLLEKITPNVLRKLAQLRDQKRLTEVSKKLGIHAPRLTELLSGKRKLSYVYLVLFVRGGIMTTEEVWGNINVSDLGEFGQLIAARMSLEDDLIRAVKKLRDKNIAPDKIIKVLSILDE